MKSCLSAELPVFGVVALAIAGAVTAAAQTDEIQVYDGEIAQPGIVNLTWHNNFTPVGLKAPAFTGGFVNNHNLNGVTNGLMASRTGLKRAFTCRSTAYRSKTVPRSMVAKFAYCLPSHTPPTASFSMPRILSSAYNSKHWDPRTYSSEIRPIIGWHLKPWDIVINPIMDNSWYGGFKRLEFVPAERVAYNLNPKWAVAVEEYADYGQFRNFFERREQFHQVWGVFDHDAKYVHIEAGLGVGLTAASDRLTLKLMLSKDLNSKKNTEPTAQPPQ